MTTHFRFESGKFSPQHPLVMTACYANDIASSKSLPCSKDTLIHSRGGIRAAGSTSTKPNQSRSSFLREDDIYWSCRSMATRLHGCRQSNNLGVSNKRMFWCTQIRITRSKPIAAFIQIKQFSCNQWVSEIMFFNNRSEHPFGVVNSTHDSKESKHISYAPYCHFEIWWWF